MPPRTFSTATSSLSKLSRPRRSFSRLALENDLRGRLSLDKELVAVENVRGGISKASMVHNSATPVIEVDPETYEVKADGELLTCEPADVLPMAQRYFLF